MPEHKQQRREPDPEPTPESSAKTATPATPRRERQYWTADTDNPLICRGID